jgi:hypothetical protein
MCHAHLQRGDGGRGESQDNQLLKETNEDEVKHLKS